MRSENHKGQERSLHLDGSISKGSCNVCPISHHECERQEVLRLLIHSSHFIKEGTETQKSNCFSLLLREFYGMHKVESTV